MRLFRLFHPLGHFIEFRVDGGLGFVIQIQAHDLALVVNGHGGIVLHRLGDVVDIDVIAEYLLGVLVHHLDGRAGEADKCRVW